MGRGFNIDVVRRHKEDCLVIEPETLALSKEAIRLLIEEWRWDIKYFCIFFIWNARTSVCWSERLREEGCAVESSGWICIHKRYVLEFPCRRSLSSCMVVDCRMKCRICHNIISFLSLSEAAFATSNNDGKWIKVKGCCKVIHFNNLL